MRKFIILILILAILAGSVIIAVLAMSRIVTIEPPRAMVSGVSGSVEIKPNGSSAWADLPAGCELAGGDRIRTGADGQAVVNFFDNSTSRIGPGSEVLFDELFINDYDYSRTKVSVMVTVGRVWSRILKILDQEAAFTVGSSVTVATVRGTAFDFEVRPSGLVNIRTAGGNVAVAAVSVEEAIDSQANTAKQIKKIISKINLPAGQEASIDQSVSLEELAISEPQAISPEIAAGDWFARNTQADNNFQAEIKSQQEELAQKIAGILPDSKFYPLKKLAEKIRVVLISDPEEKIKLKTAFIGRRLAEAQRLATAGNNQAAQEVLADYQNQAEKLGREIKALGIKPEVVRQIAGELGNQLDINRRILEATDNQVIKEKFDALEAVSELPEFTEDFILEAIDTPGEKDESPDGQNIDLPPLESPTQPAAELMPDKPSRKAEQLAPEPLREPADIYSPPEEPEPLPPPAAEINLLGVPAEPVLEPITPLEKKLERLEVKADKYNMLANSTRQFQAIAFYSDGSSLDVTSRAVWSVSGDIGEISPGGLLRSDSDGGKGVVSANLAADEAVLTASSPEVTALSIDL